MSQTVADIRARLSKNLLSLSARFVPIRAKVFSKLLLKHAIAWRQKGQKSNV